MKPQRTFNASVGQYSVDNQGPEVLGKDIDNINKMFDPDSTFLNGEQGGIGKENLNFDFMESGSDESESMAEQIGSKAISELKDPSAPTNPALTVWKQIKALTAIVTIKVDKITGKGLSTNDYDNIEKQNNSLNTSARHSHNNKAILDMLAGITTVLGYSETKVPSEKAVVDAVVNASGNMMKQIFDPQGYNQDVFEYVNKKLLSDAVVPSVGLGMNPVIRRSDGMTSIPKFTMQGKSYVNPLGKDGNCEDVSKWGTYQATATLDSTNKVFGSNSIKVTLTSTTGAVVKVLNTLGTIDYSKYYFVSAYLKNGNANLGIRVYKNNVGGGNDAMSPRITDTSKFVRSGVKMSPSDINSGNSIGVSVDGANTQYAYVDGIQINEITATEYSTLTEAQLMEKYPYVDSYACLQNPYIEIRHDNLVRNGNGEEGIGWWYQDANVTTAGTLTVVGGKLRVSSTGVTRFVNRVKLKENTDYYLNANVTDGTADGEIYIWDGTNTYMKAGVGAFNSGSYKDPHIALRLAGGGYADFDSIILIEGTTAPASYKPCRIERCVIEGKFTSDDTVTYENGEVSGLLNWKHKTLYGKDYDWQYLSDATGYKQLRLLSAMKDIMFLLNQKIVIKQDGKILPCVLTVSSADQIRDDWSSGNKDHLDISISDTDSGWAETINPNADEVKAFMNGWKAIWNDNNRYTAFKSIVDGSLPACTVQASISATTNTTAITVSSGGTQFVSGDTFLVLSSALAVKASGVVTGTPTATNIPITTTISVASGDIIIKKDNGGAGVTAILNWCKNNIAPGYEGYQLHYKLANPEPITDVNVHVHGDIPKLDNGDNYVYVDSGMVLGEVANPVTDGSNYFINTVVATALRNKAEQISSINKNQAQDSKWNIQTLTDTGLIPLYGRMYAATANANVDLNATYTADYQILKTLHTTPTTITMQYQQDVLSAVADLADGLNSRQKADSALDTLVDLSVYQKFKQLNLIGRATQLSSNECRVISGFTIIPKKCVPIATIKSLSPTYFDGVGSSQTIPVSDIILGVALITTDFVVLRASYVGSSATIRTACLNYGMNVAIELELDCRGRL